MDGRVKHPWEQAYPPGMDWAMDVPVMPVPALLERAASAHPDRPAIDYAGRIITYAALQAAVEACAAGLCARFAPGTVIALYLPNTPWHPVAFFAALKAGLVVTHLSPLDATRELAHKVADSGAHAVITTDLGALIPNAQALGLPVLAGRDAHFGEAVTALPGEVTDLATLPATPSVSWPAVRPEDLAVLQYTGGTTGAPKAAMLTHANLTAAVTITAWRGPAAGQPGEQRVLLVLPLFHIYALVVMLYSVANGNLTLLRTRFDAARVADDIELRRVTTFPAVPTMWVALEALPGIRERNLSALRWCVSGGAPMPNEVAARVTALIGTKLAQGWGMTETCAGVVRVPDDVAAEPGLVGVPLPGITVKIVALDDPSRTLGVDEVGEIAVCGPPVCAGYWRAPERTEAAFVGTFLLTGDIGRMDARGMVYLLDRKKRMLISGGFNVYPAQIEGALHEHRDIQEAIVIGVPDAYRGEAAKAFVVLRAGAAPLTLDDLRAFLADKLGRHELPAALELRETLPKSAVGKLLPSVLEAEERARLAHAAA